MAEIIVLPVMREEVVKKLVDMALPVLPRGFAYELPPQQFTKPGDEPMKFKVPDDGGYETKRREEIITNVKAEIAGIRAELVGIMKCVTRINIYLDELEQLGK